MIRVGLYETQIAILDRIEGYGEDLDSLLVRLLREHVKQRLDGRGTLFVSGLPRDDVLIAPTPAYGLPRVDVTLEPVTGKAIPMRRGEVLRIEQIEGGQCVDFNAFNLCDYKEALDCGFTRSFQSFNPRHGELIWTNAPRGRPMFAILEMSESCDLDIAGHRCNRIAQELAWGLADHPNCQDTIAEAIREYGLTPDDVHDSFNLWFSTEIDHGGRRRFKWNPAKSGDAVEIMALFDVLSVPAICGIGDLAGCNNYRVGVAIRVQVFEPSKDTMNLAAEIDRRWGSLKSQVRSDDVGAPIRRERVLQADPEYKPEFRPAPKEIYIEIELTSQDEELVDTLLDSGVYGETRSEAIRAAAMRWCNENVALIPRAKIVFTDNSAGTSGRSSAMEKLSPTILTG